jgi:hypothetical protein
VLLLVQSLIKHSQYLLSHIPRGTADCFPSRQDSLVK